MPQLRDLTLRHPAITNKRRVCLKVLTKLRYSEPARYPHDGQRPETPQEADEGASETEFERYAAKRCRAGEFGKSRGVEIAGHWEHPRLGQRAAESARLDQSAMSEYVRDRCYGGGTARVERILPKLEATRVWDVTYEEFDHALLMRTPRCEVIFDGEGVAPGMKSFERVQLSGHERVVLADDDQTPLPVQHVLTHQEAKCSVARSPASSTG